MHQDGGESESTKELLYGDIAGSVFSPSGFYLPILFVKRRGINYDMHAHFIMAMMR